MAWWGWRRRWWRPRRRWRWRRPRRRRRVPARRPRRAVRRYRTRTVRRRRRGWRRGYRRRYRLRRYRRRGRRRKRIVLTQWNPQTVRKCFIRGLMPVLWAGMGTGGHNYAVRSDDFVVDRGFGGSFATETFSLRVLYDQYQRGFNRWSHTNEDLDLARYTGCKWTFYRHQDTDFIVYFTNNPPMKTNQHTAPLTTPGMLMRSKYKILIPSFKTRPRGKKSISVRIRPPKLFQDKWYTQQDLCPVPLVQLNVTAADFTHPFGSPLTDSPCIRFQVLGDLYNKCLNIDLPQFDSQHGTIKTDPPYDRENKTHLQTLYTTLFNSRQSGVYWQTFITNTMVKAHIDAKKAQVAINNTLPTAQPSYNTEPFPTKPEKSKFENWKKQFTDTRDSNFLFATYHPEMIHSTIAEMRNNNFDLETGPNDKYGNFSSQYTRNTHMLDYYLGFYSPIFLSDGRSNTEFFTAYRDIVYNPLLDKGTGNMIWFQYHTKTDNIYNKQTCHWEILDMPLWALCNGYVEYLESQIKYGDILTEGKVLIRCPYTKPPLTDPKDSLAGYVVYNTNFGRGKWIDGKGYIPLHERSKWYVMLRYQTDVLHDIVTCGPWQYRDDNKNSQLIAKYRFKFYWGGNMLHSQVIRNPCKDTQVSGPRRQPREIQVVDPQLITPPWVLHSFDQRRGMFTETALRRLLRQPLPGEYAPPALRVPLLFPSSEFQREGEGAESDSSSPAKRPRLWQEEGSQTETNSSEGPAETTRELLERKLREQRVLNLQLQHFAVQLAKTQANLHINPLLYSQQ
uniref:Capsid protein n=1 Tax=Alphatorquevirus homin13 TaxID=3048415 RepID=A0AAU7ST90_9VIRU